MHRILLAAVAAFTLASLPAFAQDTECPQGTTKTSPDGSPVTCSADTTEEAAPAADDPGANALDATEAGQGVKDAAAISTAAGDENAAGDGK